MKALFCHDHHYYRDGNQVVSKGQFHHSLWQRYLDQFNQLTVIGRNGGEHIGDTDGVNQSCRDGVQFELLNDTNSLPRMMFGRKKSKEIIRLLVADHDVIILRGISEIGQMAYAEAKRQNKPTVMEMVACAWDELWYHGSIKAKIYAPYRFIMARRMAKNVDAILYVTQSFLQDRYPSDAPIRAVASNVQIDSISLSETSRPNHRSYKIGLIGTLKNRLKGVHIAIEAAAILRARGIDYFKMHILGPGDPLGVPCKFGQMAVDKGVDDIIVFDGIRTSGQHVLEWIRDLNLYIQPSLQEGVPRAMIEVMSQSRAVIGSNAGGIDELLNKECIVNRGDANGLADKIEWMIKNPDIQRAQAKRNYGTSQKYTMDKLIPVRQKFWGDVRSMVVQFQIR